MYQEDIFWQVDRNIPLALFNVHHRQTGFSHWSQRELQQSCLCLLICHSSKNKVDITGMAHRDIFAPSLLTVNFICVWLLADWLAFVCAYVNFVLCIYSKLPGYYCRSVGWLEAWQELLCKQIRISSVVLHDKSCILLIWSCFESQILFTGWLNILKRICQQNKEPRQPVRDKVDPKHVPQGSLQRDLHAQAERGAEAGPLPQYHSAEAGGRNQGTTLQPHQLLSRNLRSLQTSGAAEFGGAPSCAQPFFPCIYPA